MAQKESMDILIKDMKIQDARIEADIQTYAGLLGNVEKHTKELRKRKEEREIFEQFLSRIGGERDFFKDSVQIQTLEDLASAQEREITDNNNLIEEHQAYYEALRKKDYKTLWERDEDKSAMAAICFAVEQCRDTSAEPVRKLLETRDELSEDAARYLLEKVLVYSESKREADEAAEEADILLRDILSRTRFPQSDAVWQNIEICLNIRKTWRTMVKCKTVLNVYQEQKSRFEVFEQDYANNYKEISEEIKTLGNQKIGGEVTSAVKRAKEWFINRTAELDGLIKRRRNETAIIEEHLQTLQSVHAELENGMESGLQPERCDAICNTLSSMESEAAQIVDAGKLDQERKKLLEDYQKHLKTIEAAKDAEVEREKEHQRIKIEKKADRKRKSSKIALKTLIVVGIIFGLLYGIEIVDVEGLQTGFSYYLPDVVFGSPIVVINDSPSSYYITLVPKSTIQINRNNEDLSFVIDPFGAEHLRIDPPIKKLKIHNGTEKVVLNCEKLKELTIPDSVTDLSLNHLNDELALTLELPEHLESFSISESLYLTDTGFQALEIPKSVQKLSITGCDNLTDTGFQALEIPESVQELIIEGCDNLENIDIPNNLESLKICEAENLTVNVSGAVQSLYADITESLTVNVSGAVQELETISERLTVNVNGAVHTLISPKYASAGLPVVKSVTVNGQIDICQLGASVWDNSGKEEWESIYHVEFSEAPRALQLWCIGENELILPEGTEILRLNWDSEEIPIIPDSVRYLFINSDMLDFDAVNIPEGILYYELYSKKRDDRRKYKDENCPEALEDFDFDGDVPDLSGIVKSGAARKQIPSDALTWNDSSYYIFKGFETWEEAEAYCESIGGHLAVIESAEENEAVYSYVREQGYSNAFFGASDAAEEGEWRWVDGSAMSYTNWHKNEPNNDKNEDYIDYYYKDGTWNDSSFKSDGNIICEWD